MSLNCEEKLSKTKKTVIDSKLNVQSDKYGNIIHRLKHTAWDISKSLPVLPNSSLDWQIFSMTAITHYCGKKPDCGAH